MSFVPWGHLARPPDGLALAPLQPPVEGQGITAAGLVRVCESAGAPCVRPRTSGPGGSASGGARGCRASPGSPLV